MRTSPWSSSTTSGSGRRSACAREVVDRAAEALVDEGVDEELRRRRRRMKFSLRMFAMVWLPLSLVYAIWLVFAGYELARWAGVMLLVVVGFGYLALISLSLEVRGVKPLLDDDSTRS